MSDIGDKLKNARKANGMTIEDIEKITKIQRRYLYAIEENQFDQLPGDFYVRAFIKQYAQVVGLNGKELLDEYHKEVPEATPEKYVENSIGNKSQEVRKTTNNKKGLWKQYIPIAAAIIAFFVLDLLTILFSLLFFCPFLFLIPFPFSILSLSSLSLSFLLFDSVLGFTAFSSLLTNVLHSPE